jgi:hypothetical protein
VSGEKDPNLNIDVGLGAKASLEVKVSTEIPPQSTCRLVDALTDLIRPISEQRGLRADQIRLQRLEVAIKIAKMVRHLAEIENQSIYPLPNKFLVPFLEKASLEELDSVMIDRWADLLLSSAADPATAHPRYIQILSELTPLEAQLLRRIALNKSGLLPTAHTSLMRNRSFTHAPDRIRYLLRALLSDISKREDEEIDVTRTVRALFGVPGASLSSIFTTPGKAHQLVFVDLSNEPAAMADSRSLDVLISLHLVTEHHFEIVENPGVIFGSYVNITSLAVDFLKKCDRDIEKTLRRS